MNPGTQKLDNIPRNHLANQYLKNNTQFKQMMAVVGITDLYTLIKAHQTAHLKLMNSTVCKLHLDKADFLKKNACISSAYIYWASIMCFKVYTKSFSLTIWVLPLSNEVFRSWPCPKKLYYMKNGSASDHECHPNDGLYSRRATSFLSSSISINEIYDHPDVCISIQMLPS